MLALGMIVAPVIGACNGDDEVEEDAPATTQTQTQTMDELRVTEVDLGRTIDADRRVSDETDDFEATDTVYVSVDTDGTASGATLTARWTFEDGQVVDESTQNLSSTGPTVTEFHISMPDGLPAGEYQVEILLDGRSVETEEFEVN